MALIRSTHAAALIREAVVLDLGDLARQGEAILQQARADARRMISEARDQARRVSLDAAENGRIEGFDKGMTQGLEQGRAAGRAESIAKGQQDIDHLRSALSQALEEYQSIRQNLVTQAKVDLIQLALTIADRVIYRLVQYDPTIIEDQIVDALSLLGRRTNIRIRVNREDEETAQAVVPALIARLRGCHEMTVETDQSISRGGCIVSTDEGAVDATIQTQISRIVDALLPGSAPEGASLRPDAIPDHLISQPTSTTRPPSFNTSGTETVNAEALEAPEPAGGAVVGQAADPITLHPTDEQSNGATPDGPRASPEGHADPEHDEA